MVNKIFVNPFLNSGVIVAIFTELGNLPWENIELMITMRRYTIIIQQYFTTFMSTSS